MRAAGSGVDAPAWRRLTLIVLVALPIVLWGTGWLAVHLGPGEPFAGSWEALIFKGPFADLVSFWQRWDALWYQHVAQSGYHAGDGSTAFFPLYPLLSRILSFATLGNLVLAELVLSLGAFAAGMSALWRLAHLESAGRTQRPWMAGAPGRVSADRVATVTVLATALFPTGFFLFAPYTESLFLLLAVGSVLLARTGRPWAAGVLGLLAGLTRTQGVFLALPIAYEHLRERGTGRWLIGRGGRRPGRALLAAALPLCGIALFTLYQWNVVGEHHTGLDALAAWGYQVAWPWDALAAGWSYITGAGHGQNGRLVEAFNLVALGGASALLVLGAIGRPRLPGAYLLYAIPSLGLLLFREMWFSPFMSVGRYVLVVFPCFLVLGRLLAARPHVAMVALAISGVLELVLLQYWARWGFVA